MIPDNKCRFCDIASGKYQYIGIDEPFLCNDYFMAIVSIGAMVDGWTLIVPREHHLSMRDLYDNSSFKTFLDKVLPYLYRKYGSLVAFEHGANKEGSITACGTDHAHLHLVPLGETLLPDIRTSGLNWRICNSSEIVFQSEKNEYLFYCELNMNETWGKSNGYLHVLEYPISQYFRHLIAKRKGVPELSDYRRFPQLDIARQTQKELLGIFA